MQCQATIFCINQICLKDKMNMVYLVTIMNFKIELENEEDGRWIAEVLDLAGVLAYGETREEAIARVQAIALRVLADKLEYRETTSELMDVSFIAA